MLLVAVNNAMTFTQRELDLERAFEQVMVTVPDMRNGGRLSDAKVYPDGQVACEVKTVRKAFLQLSGSEFQVPIPLVSRQSYVDTLERRVTGGVYSLTQRETGIIPTVDQSSLPIQVVLSGHDRFFVSPASESVLGTLQGLVVYFDAILMLPDFVTDNDSNFLLTYCFDFMMFRSIYELNFLLKEDQRFEISMSILASVWESVKDWNSKSVGNAVSNTNLD
jgi:hypothetical protein